MTVLAKWTNGHWYPGRVRSSGARLVTVRFDDGNLHKVTRKNLIFCDLLAIGQRCFAERRVSDVMNEN